MKKFTIFGLLALAVMLVFGLVACGDDGDDDTVVTGGDPIRVPAGQLNGRNVELVINNTSSLPKAALTPADGMFYWLIDSESGDIIQKGKIESDGTVVKFISDDGTVFYGTFLGGNLDVTVKLDDGTTLTVGKGSGIDVPVWSVKLPATSADWTDSAWWTGITERDILTLNSTTIFANKGKNLKIVKGGVSETLKGAVNTTNIASTQSDTYLWNDVAGTALEGGADVRANLVRYVEVPNKRLWDDIEKQGDFDQIGIQVGAEKWILKGDNGLYYKNVATSEWMNIYPTGAAYDAQKGVVFKHGASFAIYDAEADTPQWTTFVPNGAIPGAADAEAKPANKSGAIITYYFYLDEKIVAKAYGRPIPTITILAPVPVSCGGDGHEEGDGDTHELGPCGVHWQCEDDYADTNVYADGHAAGACNSHYKCSDTYSNLTHTAGACGDHYQCASNYTTGFTSGHTVLSGVPCDHEKACGTPTIPAANHAAIPGTAAAASGCAHTGNACATANNPTIALADHSAKCDELGGTGGSQKCGIAKCVNHGTQHGSWY